MGDADYTAKVLTHCRISPPAGSVPTTSLPLSFLDLLWIICRPMRRLFFFHFPHSAHHFMESIFPTLKTSLSLALKHFFPLAGNCIFPPHPHNPHILYTTHDSVLLTVAESTRSCDFNNLIADYPTDAKQFYPFVPDLPASRLLPDGSRAVPIFAIQITVFPNQGLCVCIAFHHVVADGMAIHHFVKSWASISRNGSFDGPLPCHDRPAVNGLESIFLSELSGKWDSLLNPVSPDKPIIDLAPVDKVRATFVLTKTQIERLKIWVSAESTNGQDESKPWRLSSFIVTCALIWGCLIKSTEAEAEAEAEGGEADELCYLVLLADCRNRLKVPLPPSYFGNCLDMGAVVLKKSELLKRDSVVVVAKGIGERVEEFESEPLKKAEEWFSVWRTCSEAKHLLTIAGSPKLRAYDTDFGWGRPRKSEVLHVDSSLAISVQESRDERGGIEIGMGLHKRQMDRFIAIWEQNLGALCT